MSFVQRLANDLLALEVNTIVKSNMTGSKTTNRRRILIELADDYRAKVMEYKIKVRKADIPLDLDPEDNVIFRWTAGGQWSYKEIDDHSRTMRKILLEYCDTLQEGPVLRQLHVQIRMLDRIIKNAGQIVEMFEYQKDRNSEKIGQPLFMTEPPTVSFDPNDESQKYPSHMESRGWNNDVTFLDAGRSDVDDLELDPAEISFLRKISDIGTAQIMMQTVIQVDGDITSYISRTYLNQPEMLQKKLLGMHNEAIKTSTGFWTNLFETITKLAGQALFNK